MGTSHGWHDSLSDAWNADIHAAVSARTNASCGFLPLLLSTSRRKSVERYGQPSGVG